ncbi:MAG: serine hydrolase [Pseudomonadota bacterium]
MAIAQDDPALCGLAWATKVVASGVAVTGREATDVFTTSCNWMAAPDAMMRSVLETRNPGPLLSLQPEIAVDAAAGLTSMQLAGRTAWARRVGDQGFCVVDGPEMAPHFTPVPVPVRDTTGLAWPTGDPAAADPGASGADAALLEEAAKRAFARPIEFTNALIVLHRGELVLERYREPFDRQTRFEAWSMGKSIAATLVGVAMQDGLLDLDDDHLFEAWSGSADPRRAIRLRDILNMASGLRFTGSYGRDEDHSVKQLEGRFLDHIYVYASGVDSVAFCLDKPLADAPGEAGRYRNCDPLLATALVRDRAVGGDVGAFLTWPQARLFDRIGATGMLLETDPYGNFLISGHDYGRAIDWARLGLLHLQEGAWEGDQILPAAFAEFVRTPATRAWAHDPYYGGFFPTNATGIIPSLPADAFWMSGGGRQRVVIVPSLDLVIVRMGHMAGQAFGVDETLNAVFGLIAEAVSSSARRASTASASTTSSAPE